MDVLGDREEAADFRGRPLYFLFIFDSIDWPRTSSIPCARNEFN